MNPRKVAVKVEISEEEAKVAAENRAAADKLFEFQVELKAIKATEGWMYNDKLSARVRELISKIDELKGGMSDAALEMVKLRVLRHTVQNAASKRENIHKVFQLVATHNRASLAKTKEFLKMNEGRRPKDVHCVIFEDEVLLPVSSEYSEDGKQSPADYGLFRDVQSLIDKYEREREKKEAAETVQRIAALKAIATTGGVEEFLAHKVGTYLFTQEKPDGAMMLKVADGRGSAMIVTIEDGAGAFAAAGRVKGYWFFYHTLTNVWRRKMTIRQAVEGMKLPVGVSDPEKFREDIAKVLRFVSEDTEEARMAYGRALKEKRDAEHVAEAAKIDANLADTEQHIAEGEKLLTEADEAPAAEQSS